ncbi:MAG TPA: hypothetical protein PKI71_06175 [Candidatus Rifleibacterium sp.]|nr:hypothetical protein [Candidatus Rifleibacterium sp.]
MVNQPENDYHRRHEAELQEKYEFQERQFAALNAAMQARIKAGCSSNDCDGCGNAECVTAHKEYLKLWPENAAEQIEQEKEPASAVRTTNASTPARVSLSSAQSRNSHEQKLSERPGMSANGLTLFDLAYDDEKGKAA